MLGRSFRWRDLPLSAKGLIVTAIPMAPLLLTTVLFAVAHSREEAAENDVIRTLRIRSDVEQVLATLLGAEGNIRGYLLVGDRAFLESYDHRVQQLPVAFERISTLMRDVQQKTRLAALQQGVDQQLATYSKLLGDRAAVPVVDATDMRRSKLRMDALHALASEIVAKGDELLAARQARAAVAVRTTFLLVFGGAFLGLVGGVVAALLFSRGIAQRIERVRQNAELLGSARPLLPSPEGTDEVGQLGNRVESAARMLAERDQALVHRLREVTAAHEELESFSYSVSHDLRAPLRHIVGFAALLSNHAAVNWDDQSRRYVRIISEAATRMGCLVDDLLSFSRMGRKEMLRDQVDLSEVVPDIVRQLHHEESQRRVIWKIGDLPMVSGDQAMLRLAIANLIENAYKFSVDRDPAQIEIGTAPPVNGECVIYVKDNGAGFDMTYASKLFEVFQRLHSPEQFEGTGIGLANVRRIIERHGGRTWAEGRVNEGATFFLALPRNGERSVPA